MELNEKLQELRKQRGLTQEELSQYLFVSRTAISKWESGRGIPSIDSLKAISRFYAISLDDLLSSDTLIYIAENDRIQQKQYIRDLLFGLLDISTVIILFLPFFGQINGSEITAVSLMELMEISQYLRILYFSLIIFQTIVGVLTLSLQNYDNLHWIKYKSKMSIFIHILLVFLFLVGRQPYASAFVFTFLIIKGVLLLKQQ